jgi:hypothetical protein
VADFPIPISWDRAGLEDVGFLGFVPLFDLDAARLPLRRGVYAVLRQSVVVPEFLAENPIVKKKRYSIETLTRKWLVDTPIVYIGKADPVDGLFGRLGAFGRRSPSHSGGRAIWQLADTADLIVAWIETPDQTAESVEKTYLRAFHATYDQLPFASWRF